MKYSVAFSLAAAFALSTSALCTLPAAAATMKPQCAQTKISQVGYYFTGDPTSGIVVVFASNLGVAQFKNAKAEIVDRYSAHTSPIYRARAGDAVTLCLTQVPQSGNGCNPNKDSRGRVYTATDRRIGATFSGSNDNHDCGGA